MRLKEIFFKGPKDYTFKVEADDGLTRSVTVTVDPFRYFDIDQFPIDIPIGIYAEFISDHGTTP